MARSDRDLVEGRPWLLFIALFPAASVSAMISEALVAGSPWQPVVMGLLMVAIFALTWPIIRRLVPKEMKRQK